MSDVTFSLFVTTLKPAHPSDQILKRVKLVRSLAGAGVASRALLFLGGGNFHVVSWGKLKGMEDQVRTVYCSRRAEDGHRRQATRQTLSHLCSPRIELRDRTESLYQVVVRSLRCISLLSLLVLLGCVHIHEGSDKADLHQIQTHLAAQLHCQSLDLESSGKDSFSGKGKNDTGDFTIDVTRQAGQILFQGVYVDPTHGRFSGSASWSKNFNSSLGFYKSRESAQSSFNVQH